MCTVHGLEVCVSDLSLETAILKRIVFVPLQQNGMVSVPLKYTRKNLSLNVLGFFSLRQKLRSNIVDLLKL